MAIQFANRLLQTCLL